MSGPKPGSPEWLRFMTASKIAAVMGTSPYESGFSLWHRMHGDLAPQEQTPEMTYGNYLEPVLLRWFEDQHPEAVVNPGRWVQMGDIFGATPDGIVGSIARPEMEGLLEAKTARNAWEWEQGVPPGYYDQCQWSMFVCRAQVCWVVADVAMEFREYRVDRDEDRIGLLVREATEFMASLAAGVTPSIDGSTHTYIAIRELHPDIDDASVSIPDDLAHRWLDAKWEAGRWSEVEQQAKSEIADLMGNARRATWGDHTLFTRQARGNGSPYLVAARNLPSTQEPAA